MTLRRYLSTAVLLSLLASLLALVPLSPAGAQEGSPGLVISQVYGGGGNSGAPFTNDFVELFNRSEESVSTAGLSVQYASAGGSFNAVTTLPSVEVPVGGYFLVQLAGGSNGVALPPPDAVGTTSASATNGKFALVTGTDALSCGAATTPCSSEQLAPVIDLVGYGSANFFEGSAATPAPSNSTSVVRLAGGCTDTDDNRADFVVANPPTPRNSASDAQPCAGLNQNIVPDCPASLAVHEGFDATGGLTATDPDGTVVDAAITSTPVAGIALTDTTPAPETGGTLTTTLQVTGVPQGTYDVEVTFGNDDPTPQSAVCAITVRVAAAGQTIGIHDVQGPGSATPLQGQTVTIEGIATSLLTRNRVLDGFFLQGADDEADDDPLTSEGIFIFCRNICPDVDVRDRVRVTGVATEFFDMTQVSVTSFNQGVISIGAGDQTLPTAVAIELPKDPDVPPVLAYEAVEGMIVAFPQTLTVSEFFQLDRFGQITLTAGDRPFQFTHTNLPDIDGFAAHLAEVQRQSIILDDDNNDQNSFTTPPVDLPYPYPSPGLSVDNFMRAGDTIAGLTGVMHWSFNGLGGTDAWRIRPIPEVDYTFESANPRTDAPNPVGGTLTVASFNVLNYFTTLNNPGNTCGPNNLGCRGANSPSELERQRAKIVAALVAIDADVVGLIELENDGDDSSIADLVAGLNAVLGEGTYDFLATGSVGTDAIKNGFIFKPAAVELVGETAILDSSVDPRFRDTRSRPVIVQAFEEVATGEQVVLAVNHFKSKGSNCNRDGDPDLRDGQANCNVTRTMAAEALVDFLETDPTMTGADRYLVMGDLNAYRLEDPIQVFLREGYADLITEFLGDEGYSFLFDGQLGYLDHALANEALLPFVTGVAEWHINSDELPLLDYNDEILDPGERAFNRKSGVLPLYAPTPFRSSDHDPVIIGLQLGAPVADAGGPYTVRVGQTVQLDATASTGGTGDLSYAWDLNGNGQFTDAVGAQPTVRVTGPPGERTISVRVTDAEGAVDVASAVLTVTTGEGGVPPGRG
ncbi:ExeM/NucH family extracellular endonuclease [soil metagenome]